YLFSHLQNDHLSNVKEHIQLAEFYLNDYKHDLCSFNCCCLFFNCCYSDLSEPVDVYSDWIDACEAANQ
ncbi:hypothetical protein scyTo_0023982, partial [Scyliorhinus torazame]|nr:hypothetical protein [Scyliorhinus torazame]